MHSFGLKEGNPIVLYWSHAAPWEENVWEFCSKLEHWPRRAQTSPLCEWEALHRSTWLSSCWNRVDPFVCWYLGNCKLKDVHNVRRRDERGITFANKTFIYCKTLLSTTRWDCSLGTHFVCSYSCLKQWICVWHCQFSCSSIKFSRRWENPSPVLKERWEQEVLPENWFWLIVLSMWHHWWGDYIMDGLHGCISSNAFICTYVRTWMHCWKWALMSNYQTQSHSSLLY